MHIDSGTPAPAATTSSSPAPSPANTGGAAAPSLSGTASPWGTASPRSTGTGNLLDPRQAAAAGSTTGSASEDGAVSPTTSDGVSLIPQQQQQQQGSAYAAQMADGGMEMSDVDACDTPREMMPDAGGGGGGGGGDATPWLRSDEHRLNALQKLEGEGALSSGEAAELAELSARHEAFIEEGVRALRNARPPGRLRDGDADDACRPPPRHHRRLQALCIALAAIAVAAGIAAALVVTLQRDEAAFSATSPPTPTPPAHWSSPIRIDTPSLGPIVGVRQTSPSGSASRRFLGLPYARPPVGELRWQPPEPLPARVGQSGGAPPPLTAAEFRPGCLDPTGGGEEDCLYLNIFVPNATSPSEPLPVMYWIYGGCFTWGYGSGIGAGSPDYHGDILAEEQRVIVVTVEFRIGVFGFLAHENLREKAASSGKVNSTGVYGLLDNVMALSWIQANIASFGGDPNRVTLFGQSSGSGLVSSLQVSPQASGLFSGAIMHSGAFPNWISQDVAASQRNFGYISREMGCSGSAESVLACLQSADAKELAKKSSLPSAEIPCRDGCSWAPVVDGVVLPATPWALLSGEAPGPPVSLVPTITLSTLDDGVDFVDDTTPMPKLAGAEELRKWIATTFNYPGHDPTKDLLGIYYPDDLNGSAGGEAAGLYPRGVADATRSFRYYAAAAMETDFGYACPARRTAMDLAGLGGGTRHFVGVVRSKSSFQSFVAHSQDIKYVFGNAAKLRSEADRNLSRIMMGYWANFAKAGDPNGEGLPQWPAASTASDVTQLFDTFPVSHVYAAQAYRAEACSYWDAHWSHWGGCLPQPGSELQPCTVVSGAQCVIPFGIGGHTWSSCAEHVSEPWCPTSVDAAGNPLETEACSAGCPTEPRDVAPPRTHQRF